MTLCPWRWTPGKVAPQRRGVPSLFSSPHLFVFISSLSSGFWAPLRIPVSLFSLSYLSSISLVPTQFSCSLLMFAFIFLPVSCPHLSLFLTGCRRASELVTRTWTRCLKKSVIPCQDWPCSPIFSSFVCSVV